MSSTMGQKRIDTHLIIHLPTSEGVNEVSERASEQVSAVERASKASRAEQVNE